MNGKKLCPLHINGKEKKEKKRKKMEKDIK